MSVALAHLGVAVASFESLLKLVPAEHEAARPELADPMLELVTRMRAAAADAERAGLAERLPDVVVRARVLLAAAAEMEAAAVAAFAIEQARGGPLH